MLLRETKRGSWLTIIEPRISIWTTALLVIAILVAALLLAAPLGTRAGLWNHEVGLQALLAVLIGGVLTVLMSASTSVWAHKNKLASARRSAVLSSVIALLPALFVGIQIATAWGLPMIHDISTDTVDPPVFTSPAIVHAERANALEYGGVEIAKRQLAAYPRVKSITSEMSLATAFEHALASATALKWELVERDRQTGRIEAVATTFWFGFKDDIVIRLRSEGTGSRVDLRSVSRVGLSDAGANAARIEAFIRQFDS